MEFELTFAAWIDFIFLSEKSFRLLCFSELLQFFLTFQMPKPIAIISKKIGLFMYNPLAFETDNTFKIIMDISPIMCE